MAPAVVTYEPRDPSSTLLYQVVAEHLETFLASLAADPNAKGLPVYVHRIGKWRLITGTPPGGVTQHHAHSTTQSSSEEVCVGAHPGHTGGCDPSQDPERGAAEGHVFVMPPIPPFVSQFWRREAHVRLHDGLASFSSIGFGALFGAVNSWVSARLLQPAYGLSPSSGTGPPGAPFLPSPATCAMPRFLA